MQVHFKSYVESVNVHFFAPAPVWTAAYQTLESTKSQRGSPSCSEIKNSREVEGETPTYDTESSAAFLLPTGLYDYLIIISRSHCERQVKCPNAICRGIEQNIAVRSSNPLDSPTRWACLQRLSPALRYLTVPPGLSIAVFRDTGFCNSWKIKIKRGNMLTTPPPPPSD